MITSLFSSVKDFRYERKFYIKGLFIEEIESILKLHPAGFREIYHQRFVNNIYFDSFDMHHYADNLNGLNRRLKVRIRWYGDLLGHIESPMLELKFKHNLHIGKKTYPLRPFVLNESFTIKTIQEDFDNSSLPPVLKIYLKDLNFSLLNRYSRKYFLSADRKYRITTDIGMEMYKLFPEGNTFLHMAKDAVDVILELKYAKFQDEYVDSITNCFNFRMTRSSKYTEGVERLNLL